MLHETAAASADATSHDNAIDPVVASDAASATCNCADGQMRAVDARMAADATEAPSSNDEITVADQREAATEEPSSDDDDDEFEIKRLASHRVDEDLSVVEFRVEWKAAEPTWEAERDLQLQVPALVIDYWDKRGGRQTATGLDEFHVLKLLDCRPKPPSYLVQWVGYRSTPRDTTWESKKTLREIAPEQLAEFDASRPRSRPGRPKKRGSARGSEPARKRSKPA